MRNSFHKISFFSNLSSLFLSIFALVLTVSIAMSILILRIFITLFKSFIYSKSYLCMS
jgi:hypothetical protein